VAVLVEIVLPIEFENEIAVDRRRITRRVAGTDTGRQTFDDPVRVWAVEIGN